MVTLFERLKRKNEIKPIIYARVSTDDQARNGFSIASQVTMGKEIIKKNNWNCVVETEIIKDDGISGTHENRAGYKRVIELIKSGERNLVIVTDTDRIGRETYISQKFASLCISYDVELYVITDPSLDIYTPSGMLQFTIKSAVNTYEVKKTRASAERGIIRSFQEGNYANPNQPYGYKKVKKKLVIIPSEAEVVRMIHKMYCEEGQSIRNIVTFLNLKKTGDRSWGEKTVKTILSNKVYIGIVHRKDLNRDFKLDHEHIVSVEIKMKALELLKERTRNVRKKSKHLFKNKVYCAKCKKKCICDTTTKSSGIQYRYYYCVNGCKQRINQAVVDKYISQYFFMHMLSKSDVEGKKQLLQAINQFLEREESLFELFQGGYISKTEYRGEIKRIKADKHALVSSLKEADQQSVVWEQQSNTQKRNFIKYNISKIMVNLKSKLVVEVR